MDESSEAQPSGPVKLTLKRKEGKTPRATLHVYGEETVEAMNQIVDSVGRSASRIIGDWILQVHAEMVENGQIRT